MPAPPAVALSVKQPWAALLAAGVKTVEVRTWPTSRRGTVYLHAAKVPDDRPHGWTFIDTPARIEAAERAGGVIAVGELVDCVTYSTAEEFAADAARHRNLPSWFQSPRLYGFVFADVRPVTFKELTGKTFFFPVSGWNPSPLGERGRGEGESERVTGAEEMELASPESPSPLTPLPQGRGGLEQIQLPPPPERVIIIDPPEGKDARHHDDPDRHQDRPAG